MSGKSISIDFRKDYYFENPEVIQVEMDPINWSPVKNIIEDHRIVFEELQQYEYKLFWVKEKY